MVDDGAGVRWGIIGTGGIARAFAADLALLPDATVAAVGSRSAAGAADFADWLQATTGARLADGGLHAGYEDLVADDGIDAVYVATPHPGHLAAARLALEAGKAVLVEKPFTLNAAEARELADLARSRGAFLMEAMWTRFLPHTRRVRSLLDEGALGEVMTLVADHGQWFAHDPAHRLFAPDLGGGALLDLGVYPVSFASFVFGTPEHVTARSTPAFTGVDAQTSAVLDYTGGRQAVVTTTLSAATANTAAISGTEARLELDRTWYAPTSFALTSRGGEVLERYDAPHEGLGLRHEAAEVGRCLQAGLLESPLMTLDETVAVMTTLDEIRAQIGLDYPQER